MKVVKAKLSISKIEIVIEIRKLSQKLGLKFFKNKCNNLIFLIIII